MSTNVITGAVVVVLVVVGVFVISHKSSPAQPEVATQTSPPPSAESKTVVQPQQQKTIPTPTEKKTSPKPPSESKLRLIPGKVTAYVTDQYGNPTGGTKDFSDTQFTAIWDSLGERAGQLTLEGGRLESKTVLPAGQYKIQIGNGLIPPLAQGHNVYTPVVRTFTLPPEGVDLGTIILNRWGVVKVKVINEVGTPLDAHEFLTQCEITDEVIKKEYDNRGNTYIKCGSFIGNTDSSFDGGSLINNNDIGGFPVGSYTVHISKSGYEAVEKSFTVNNRDIDLGTIVLKKQ